MTKNNDALVSLLSSAFQKRYEANFAWVNACSAYLALPAVNGFWPLSANVPTLGGGAASLTSAMYLTNNNNARFSYAGLAPCVRFDGATNYLSYADTGAGGYGDITGAEAFVVPGIRGLTMLLWILPDTIPAGARYSIMGKWNAATGNRSYLLWIDAAASIVQFSTSSTGANSDNLSSTRILYQNEWSFIAARFQPAATVDKTLFVGDSRGLYSDSQNSAYASLFDGAALFGIGGGANIAGATRYFPGNVSLAAICACALSDATIWSVFQQTRALFGE